MLEVEPYCSRLCLSRRPNPRQQPEVTGSGTAYCATRPKPSVSALGARAVLLSQRPARAGAVGHRQPSAPVPAVCDGNGEASSECRRCPRVDAGREQATSPGGGRHQRSSPSVADRKGDECPGPSASGTGFFRPPCQREASTLGAADVTVGSWPPAPGEPELRERAVGVLQGPVPLLRAVFVLKTPCQVLIEGRRHPAPGQRRDRPRVRDGAARSRRVTARPQGVLGARPVSPERPDRLVPLSARPRCDQYRPGRGWSVEVCP